MIVLGCDPSLTDSGWAVLDLSKEGSERFIASGRIRSKSDELFIVRYARPRDEFAKLMDKYEPDFVSIEKPQHNSSWSAGLYPIWINIADQSFERRIPFVTFLPSQIKAYARGILDDSGKMFKSDMVDAAKMILDTKESMNHNIADAILIGWLGGRLKMLIDEKIEEKDLSKKEQYMFTRTITRRATGRVDKVGMLWKEGDAYYSLKKSKYDPLYEEESVRMQRLDYSDIYGGTRNSLIEYGIEKAPEILEFVKDAEDEKEAIAILKQIDGVGKKGATDALRWANAVTQD